MSFNKMAVVARYRLRRDAGSYLKSVWIAAQHQEVAPGSTEQHIYNVMQFPIVKKTGPQAKRLRPIGGVRSDIVK
jgi:hypothetical protein